MAFYQSGIVLKMMRHIVTYNRYDIVKVPFPFTDKYVTKNRPALIISAAKSFNRCIGHSVMAMITSAKHNDWPLDTQIKDLDSAGLPVASIIRLKLFTLDHRLIINVLGQLADCDKAIFEQNFSSLVTDQD